MPLTLLLLGYTALLTLLAVVSAMETAVVSVRDARGLLSRHVSGRVREELKSILANPFLHLHRTLLVSAALNLALTALAMFIIVGPLREMRANPWIAALVLFGITVLLGDVLPKFIAVRAPAAVLFSTIRFLGPLRLVLDPLALLAERASDRLLHVFVPRHLKSRQPITVDELETLIEMREEQHVLTPSEAAILTEILDIGHLTVRDCMVPRVDMQLIEAPEDESAMVQALERCRERFAVIHGQTPDNVLGIVDVAQWKVAGRPAWREALREPVFVPETFSAVEALQQHLTKPGDCVLVMDEYGGLEGMLTQDELIDWLLHDAAPGQDSTDEVRASGPGRWLADGTARVDHIAELLDVPLEPEGIDTIGGLVFNHLGYLPRSGEQTVLQGIKIKVKRVYRRRIQLVELHYDRTEAHSDE